MSNNVLKTFSRNVDSLKGAGLSLAHLAVEAEETVKSQLRVTKDGMVQLRPDNFQALVFDSEDTWLVHFFDRKSQHAAEEQRFARVWGSVAAKLKGLISVGAMDITDLPINEIETLCSCSITDNIHIDIVIDSDSAVATTDTVLVNATGLFRPSVVVYPGGSREQIVSYPADFSLTSTNISNFALDILMDPERKLESGSAALLGAKARRLFRAASNHLRSVGCMQSMVQ